MGQDLTEEMIRPVMCFCQDSAAKVLKVSKDTMAKACKRLGLKWPKRPEVPTTDRQRALTAKKKHRDRVPRNSDLILYCEKEDEVSVRFHEVRISSDGRTVFERYGRSSLFANKKTRYANREEGVEKAQARRAEQLHSSKGFIEKPAPSLPFILSKDSKRKKMQVHWHIIHFTCVLIK